MRFIVDANLPDEVSVWLRSIGHEAWHVNELHEVGAADNWIWHEAIGRAAAIITQDGDFSDWCTTRSPAPPLVWIRTGNLRKAQLLERLRASWLRVLNQLNDGHAIVEVR
ncbi:DUF5615 family PIN-like protein [Brevundimonas subvibrioides]|uniref:DUF5615 family PIN-like protein n=1 Tax=Brevundimonas subvibrioides TaxID=74313 RepID=UPI0022B2DC5E|nr:DUF5615 family PIN-like protein [Brevundimonas subvibrioides]